MAHLFGGPSTFRAEELDRLRETCEELTPGIPVDKDIFTSPDGPDEYRALEAEIRRVFGKLRGKQWICCTTHFVQNHCFMEDLRLPTI